MKNKFAALIETRKIIAISFAATFIFLMVTGKITSDQGLPLITMAIGYYFGGSTARDNPKKAE